MQKPTVVILAGGENLRFFPLNSGAHKSTLTLLGQTILQKTLENLESHGFEKVVLVVPSKTGALAEFETLLAQLKLKLKIKLITQENPSGMGDALLLAKEQIDNKFAVIRPSLINAGELLDKMLEHKAEAVLTGIKTQTPEIYGIYRFESKKPVEIIEKPKAGQAPSDIKVEAVYLLNQKFLEFLAQEPSKQYSFEAALNKLLKQESVALEMLEREYPSDKYPWQLFDFQKEFFNRLDNFRDPTAKVAPTAILDDSNGAIYLAAGAKIGHAAKIVGPAYLGKNSLVGDFSFLRQSSLEENAVIGANSELVRSIMLKNSSFHFGYVADSIIGKNVQIGAGIITANKRLDRGMIKTKVKGKLIATGKKALGVIIGEGAKLGIGVRTMPGVLIGPKCQILPGEIIKKNLS